MHSKQKQLLLDLGVGDLGSRDDTKTKVSGVNVENTEDELKKNAYQNEYKNAAEASRHLPEGFEMRSHQMQ